MVIQINVKNPEGLKDGDILIYDGKNFNVITKAQITLEVEKQIKKLENEVKMLKQQVEKTKESVNNRQKRFIKAFVKGE